MNRMSLLRTALIVGVTLLTVGQTLQARVTRIQITSREVVAGGMSFGTAGAYEKLSAA